MPIVTDPTLILSQILSPAFPVGAFAFSHGLEAAIACGDVTTPGDLEHWLIDILRGGTGGSEAILIRVATSDVTRAEEEALARAGTRERALEATQIGAAMCRQLRAVWALDLPDLTYPVAFGAAVTQLSLPLDRAIAMYLHAFVGNLISGAQRLMPLGQTEAQAILMRLAPLCETIASDSRGMTLDDIATQCIAADIASMAHETLEPRIFRT